MNPELEHVLLNEATAIDYIARHYGARELAAFKACGIPAMQADYLRLCFMGAEGGVYLDADQQPSKPLSDLIAKAPHALIVSWLTIIGNNILMFRKPNHPFIRACRDLATDNILARRFDDVLISTGPGLFNAVRCVADPSVRSSTQEVATNGGWTKVGWDDLLAIAEKTIGEDAELTSGVAALTLIDIGYIVEWIGQDVAAYKATDRNWHRWKGSIYR